MKKNNQQPQTNPTITKNGKLFIISAPSGAGKTTICKAILKEFAMLLYSVSYTTRAPRQGEQHGLDYFFVSQSDFIKGIEQGQWAEWAQVHGNYYGTSAQFIDAKLSDGYNVLLDIDVQGALQILKKYPTSVSIFIMPPSFDVLQTRLYQRGTENTSTIEKRLLKAKEEMAQKDKYHHIVINDQLDRAIADVRSIIHKHSSEFILQQF
ncbi:MAG: guanylate kinase [Desulfobacterales bacterium]|nr:guanylate kinase [Desulfobacterales bacterium]